MNAQKGKAIRYGHYSLGNCTLRSRALQLLIKGGKDHSAPTGSGLSSQRLHLTAGWKHHGSPPPPQLCAPTAHPNPSSLEGPSSLLPSLCTPPWEPPLHRAAGPGGWGRGWSRRPPPAQPPRRAQRLGTTLRCSTVSSVRLRAKEEARYGFMENQTPERSLSLFCISVTSR